MVHTSRISSEKVSVEPVQMIFQFAMIKFAEVDPEGVQGFQARQFFHFHGELSEKKQEMSQTRDECPQRNWSSIRHI